MFSHAINIRVQDKVSLMPRDKTDTFVSIVYEDTAVATDTINDTLSPRRMPWHQRAFELRMFDPKSSIFVGVFDRDLVCCIIEIHRENKLYFFDILLSLLFFALLLL